MQSQNKYIGDDKFTKMLEHYHCPADINLIKLRFAGAISSPNLNLRPTDVISSLWAKGQEPRLQTKEEAELFFKFFMGLWDEIFEQIKLNKISLPIEKIKTIPDLITFCTKRCEQIEAGYLEGFWGGEENLKIPAFIAQILDSISDLCDIYQQFKTRDIKDSEFDNVVKTLLHTDKMVNRSISFITENYVLPRFQQQTSQIN